MANLITDAKAKLGLTDETLGALLGLHRTTVLRMEKRGKVSGPTAVLLEKLLADSRSERAA